MLHPNIKKKRKQLHVNMIGRFRSETFGKRFHSEQERWFTPILILILVHGHSCIFPFGEHNGSSLWKKVHKKTLKSQTEEGRKKKYLVLSVLRRNIWRRTPFLHNTSRSTASSSPSGISVKIRQLSQVSAWFTLRPGSRIHPPWSYHFLPCEQWIRNL